jgi:4-amino-4-deoxy-L-arabinose transferase-like glycosyltransferase
VTTCLPSPTLPRPLTLPLPPPVRAAAVRNHLFVVVSILVAVWGVFQNAYRLSAVPLMPNEDLYARMGWAYVHWDRVPATARVPAASNFEHPPAAKMLFGLAQLVADGHSVLAIRLVAVGCTLVTSLLLAGWLGRVAGRWVGLAVAGAFLLVPEPAFIDTTRYARVGSLDAVCQLFMVATLAAGWSWSQQGGKRSWLAAGACGLSLGLAVASKENGGLAFAGPLLLAFYWSRTSWRRLGAWIAQAATILTLAAGTVLACYAPYGSTWTRIGYLLRFQSDHSANGHLVGFAGQIAIHPPWWANFWFAGHALGSGISCVVITGTAAAVILRRDPIVRWLATALAGPIVFHCFYAGVALPYYWTLWLPLALALAALGFDEIARRLHAASADWRLASLILAAVLVPVLIGAGLETGRVATLRPAGAAVAGRMRGQLHLHGDVLATGTFRDETAPLLPSATVLNVVPKDLTSVDMILLARPRCRIERSPQVRALVAANLAAARLQLAHADHIMQIYLVTAPLIAPTAEQIRAQPPEHLRDHC